MQIHHDQCPKRKEKKRGEEVEVEVEVDKGEKKRGRRPWKRGGGR